MGAVLELSPRRSFLSRSIDGPSPTLGRSIIKSAGGVHDRQQVDTYGSVLRQHATQFPDKLGCQDQKHEFHLFRNGTKEAADLANALTKMGCGHGDRFGVIAFNRVRMDGDLRGLRKGGQISVPLLFRLAGPEIQYILSTPVQKL